MGTPFIFKSQLQALMIEFDRIVTQVLNGLKLEYYVGDRHKIVESQHFHKEELC